MLRAAHTCRCPGRMKGAEMFQNSQFITTLALQRHHELLGIAERNHRNFRRPIGWLRSESAQVINLPVARQTASRYDTQVA